MEDDNRPNCEQVMKVRSKATDPAYMKANELLRQLDSLKTERVKLFRQIGQYSEKIDSVEAEFNRLVLMLEPTEVVTHKPRTKVDPAVSKLQEALASKLADSPSLEEQLKKILGL